MQTSNSHRLLWPIAVVGWLFTGLPAIAADLETGNENREFVLIPEVSNHSWEGAYAGITIGATGGGGSVNRGSGNGGDTFDNDAGSAGLGGHVGYNFGRFGGGGNGGFMLGVEFDLAGVHLENDKSDPVVGKTKLEGEFLSSARVRAGYAWDSAFIYGTFGLGFTDMDLKPVGVNDNDDDVRAGIAFGVGVEVAVTEKWTTRFDAIGYDFGDQTYEFNGVEREVELSVGTLRLGVSRQF